MGPYADGCYIIEIRNIKHVLVRLRNKEIPFSFGWHQALEFDYDIYSQSDSEQLFYVFNYFYINRRVSGFTPC